MIYVICLPLYMHDQKLIPPTNSKINRVLLCGSLSPSHGRRYRLVQSLRKQNIPLDVIRCRRDEFYAIQ